MSCRRSPHARLALLCLALSLALTSVHWAVGRAMAQGGATIEICADGGISTLTLDAGGRPVQVHHTCPDCVLGGVALASGHGALAVAPVLQTRRVRRMVASPTRRIVRRSGVLARGPPALV